MTNEVVTNTDWTELIPRYVPDGRKDEKLPIVKLVYSDGSFVYAKTGPVDRGFEDKSRLTTVLYLEKKRKHGDLCFSDVLVEDLRNGVYTFEELKLRVEFAGFSDDKKFRNKKWSFEVG